MASNSKTDSDRCVLYVWPGEWDLSSLDAECLTIMVRFYILKKFLSKKTNFIFFFFC